MTCPVLRQEVYFMFYDETVAAQQVSEEPSLVFELIKEEHTDFVAKLLSKRIISVNVTDENGDSLLMKLLRVGRYDIVLKHMSDKEFDINHQNLEGDTFAHILAGIHYVNVVDIIQKLKKNKNFIPNIKNNKGETILDKSINEKYIYTTVKILEDTRFDNIDILSFKNLYNAYIKNREYGKYAKLTNFDMILENLDKKQLLPRMEVLVSAMKNNYETIKKELIKNNVKVIDEMIDTCLVESI